MSTEEMDRTTRTLRTTMETLRPGDAGYEEAARVFFATGEPAVVVRPRDAEEVAAALTYATRGGLPVSVRSGGHGLLGHGTNTGGLVIDLARLDDVEILDAGRRVVRVGGGATWGRVSAVLGSRGWAITSGDTADVGVGGLTLGGGIGWMVRRFGLAVDSLVGARVVTADGRIIRASSDEHPDLFWALRGGGGNFGVVVELDFVAQPVATVHFGAVTYHLDDPVELVSRWRDTMRGAPDELSSTLVLMPAAPGGSPSAQVLACYAGDPGLPATEGDARLDPLFSLGAVSRATLSERRYADVLEEAREVPGVRMVVRNTLVRALDPAVVDAIARVHRAPGPRMIALRSLGGAFGRVEADATAFAHRDAEAMVVCGAMLPEAAGAADIGRALGPWGAVTVHGIGTYLNFQGSATADDLAAAYPPATYARLAAVKRAYDPGNLFSLNHNVAPGRPAGAGNGRW